MLLTAIFSTILSVVCGGLYTFFRTSVWLSLTITFATTAYHFIMRLTIGHIINAVFHNNIDYTKQWFKPYRFEKKLYASLKVHKWKDKLPTYSPDFFKLSKNNLELIAGSMCQAEIVHEIIAVLSFLPIIASRWFGSTLVFTFTSIAAALFDLLFVILQRYNRPRIIAILKRNKTKIKITQDKNK